MFKVEKMTSVDVSALYSDGTCALVKKYGCRKPEPCEIKGSYCVADSDRNINLSYLHNDFVMCSDSNYLLSFNGETVVIILSKSQLYPIVHFRYVPETLTGRMDEVRAAIAEAFEIGGRWCSGIENDVIDTVFPCFED